MSHMIIFVLGKQGLQLMYVLFFVMFNSNVWQECRPTSYQASGIHKSSSHSINNTVSHHATIRTVTNNSNLWIRVKHYISADVVIMRKLYEISTSNDDLSHIALINRYSSVFQKKIVSGSRRAIIPPDRKTLFWPFWMVGIKEETHATEEGIRGGRWSCGSDEGCRSGHGEQSGCKLLSAQYNRIFLNEDLKLIRAKLAG